MMTGTSHGEGLPSARSHAAITTINNNAIGGCTNGGNTDSSSLTTVELGQARPIT